jgi:hypothetical protein
MPIDLSQERDDDESPIDAGIYRLKAKIIPGGFGEDDLLKLTKRGTLAYLWIKNTVIDGESAGAEIWDMINIERVPTKKEDPAQVATDERTAKWGRGRVKRIVASAHAINIETADEETIKRGLTIKGWGAIDGMSYWAEVGIEEASGKYKAKNTVARIITPADSDWPGSSSQPKLPTRPVKDAGNAKDDMNDSIPF